jgi:polysaccharide export outer membrane protein
MRNRRRVSVALWVSWIAKCTIFGLVWLVGVASIDVSVAADELIGSGDLLQVRVFGDASGMLSGPFRVRSDGAIDFPVLGRIVLGGKSIDEASKLLTASLSEQNIDASAYVQISEYAPVFVIGDVGRPGAFPFRPGLTIFDVVAETGGLPTSGDFRNQLAAAERERADLEFLEFSLSVQRARLRAEILEQEFDVSQFSGRDTEDEKSIIATQKSIYDAHKQGLIALKQSLQAQQDTYVQEAESLQQSISLHNQEVSDLEDQVRAQRVLAEKGLVTQSKVLEMNRQLSVTRREALEFRTALFRAEQNKLLTLQKIVEAKPTADMLNLDLLTKIDSDFSRTRLSLLAVKTSLSNLKGGDSGPRTSLGRQALYTVIRTTSPAGRTEQAATEMSTLERGDIVRVELPSAAFDSVVSSIDRTMPKDAGNEP